MQKFEEYIKEDVDYTLREQNDFVHFFPDSDIRLSPENDVIFNNRYHQKLHVSFDFEDYPKAVKLLTPFLLKRNPPIYFKIYDNSKIEADQKLKYANWRVFCGAQFTIYIPTQASGKGKSSDYRKLQEEINQLLSANNIRPGVLPVTDAILNKYVSFRIDKAFDGQKMHLYDSDRLAPGNYDPGIKKGEHDFLDIINDFKSKHETENRHIQSHAISKAAARFDSQRSKKSPVSVDQEIRVVESPEIYTDLKNIIANANRPIKEIKNSLQQFAKKTIDFDVNRLAMLFSDLHLDPKKNQDAIKARDLILEYRVKEIKKQALREAFSFKKNILGYLSLIIFPVISLPAFFEKIADNYHEILRKKLDIEAVETSAEEIQNISIYKYQKSVDYFYYHSELPGKPKKIASTPEMLEVLTKKEHFKTSVYYENQDDFKAKKTIYLPVEKAVKFLRNQKELHENQEEFNSFKNRVYPKI